MKHYKVLDNRFCPRETGVGTSFSGRRGRWTRLWFVYNLSALFFKLSLFSWRFWIFLAIDVGVDGCRGFSAFLGMCTSPQSLFPRIEVVLGFSGVFLTCQCWKTTRVLD